MGFKMVRSGVWLWVCLLVFLMVAGSALLAADAASAARYTVAQCGWHVGQDANWLETSSDKFTRDSYCQAPANADPFENVHLTSSTRGSTTSVSGTRFARWHWQAPAGTGIVTVHGQRWQVLGNNFEHRIGGVVNGNFTPFLQTGSTDTVRRDFSQAFSPNADGFESRLLCAMPEDRFCAPANERMAGVRALTFTLEDALAPTAVVGGPASGAGWMHGTQTLNFSGSDRGSGVRFSRTSVDGSTAPQTEQPCDKELIAGEWRGTRMLPCRLSVSGSHQIDTTKLSDGPHLLRHCSIDFAGNTGCAADRILHTDNTAPDAPRGLVLEGGEGWHRSNGFNLGWANPAQGVAAPIVASLYRVSGEGFDSGPIGTGDSGLSGAIRGALVPRAGQYRLSVWLMDAAGNAIESNSVAATIRFDNVAPSAYLVDPDPDQPELIRAAASDQHSGVAGGRISVRRPGDEWIDLPTEKSGSPASGLSAHFPSDDLEPGIYSVRAAVADAAGNLTVTTLRGNGSPMELRAPIKTETRLSARLHGGSRQGLALRVPYRGKSFVKGRLTAADGQGLAGQTVEVIQSPVGGARASAVTRRIETGTGGWFRLAVPAGPSREISVRFGGTDRYSAVSVGPLELKVRGLLTLAVSPRRLSNGGRVRFHGRVGSRGVRMPRRGSMVAVQYLEKSTGRWRPVLVTRTDARGRFSASYRFRYVTETARIRLRARLLPPPGFAYDGATSKPVQIEVAA